MTKKDKQTSFNYFSSIPKLRLTHYEHKGDRCIAHSTYELAESFIEVKWEWLVIKFPSYNLDFYISLN